MDVPYSVPYTVAASIFPNATPKVFCNTIASIEAWAAASDNAMMAGSITGSCYNIRPAHFLLDKQSALNSLIKYGGSSNLFSK